MLSAKVPLLRQTAVGLARIPARRGPQRRRGGAAQPLAEAMSEVAEGPSPWRKGFAPWSRSSGPCRQGVRPCLEAFARVTLGRMSPCFRADARLHSAQCNLALGRMSLTGKLPRTAQRLAGTAGWLVKPTSGEMTAPRGRAPRHGNLGLRHAGRAPRHAGLGGRQRKEGLRRRPYFFGDTPLFGGRGDMVFENFYYFCADEHIVIVPNENVAATLVQPSGHPASLFPRTITSSAEGARHKPVLSRVYASFLPAFTQ